VNQQQHEQACQQEFGHSFPDVHTFLDQYYPRFPGQNHRILLHHQLGVELVIKKFGEHARGPAEQHIKLDWGFLPKSWEELEQYWMPLSLEEEKAIELELEKLYPE